MPITANEDKRLSDLLKFTEADALDKGYIFEYVTANEAAAETYVIGTLLGEVTASGKYVISDSGAADGSETVSAVVVEKTEVPATTDTLVKCLVRGKASVADQALELGNHTLADVKADLGALNPPVLVDDQI